MIGFKSDFEIFETVDLVSGDIKYGTINLNKNTQEFEFVFIKSNMNCGNINKLIGMVLIQILKEITLQSLKFPMHFKITSA